MKNVLLLVILTTTTLFAVEKQELMSLVEFASTNREAVYVEVRNQIIKYGKDALPVLGAIAVDETLPWQQRLVARICYERIERKEDCEDLHDTESTRGTKTIWEVAAKIARKDGRESRSNPNSSFGEALKDIGLWYHYLEWGWKIIESSSLYGPRVKYLWVQHCQHAVRDNPEERIWFLRVCDDLIQNTPLGLDSFHHHDWLKFTLWHEQKADAVPLILRYVPLLNKQNLYGRLDSTIFNMLDYADERSADMLHEYVEKWWPSVARTPEFIEALAVIRARPAPPPASSPFRLDAKIIKVPFAVEVGR